MNHIHRLQSERDAARDLIASARDELTELMSYLTSSKFAAPDADYVHVRTDILPKLSRLRAVLSVEG